jgi:F0F1-type ATP synthase assembly protein I
MDERDEQAPLRDLEQRLDRARRGRETSGGAGGGGAGQVGSGLAQGLRIGLELVVALVVGVGVGWAFDTWLGAAPWGVILGFFLGMAGGIANVYRVMMGISRAVGYRSGGSPAQQGKVDWSDDED